MAFYAKPIDHLIDTLTRLPGIGKKTASRLALHILRSSSSEAQELAKAILDVKEKIRLCSTCFNLTDEDPCRICQDSQRSRETLCVVEGPNDLMAVENTGVFNGKYHVLHGTISPLEGIGPDDIKIKELVGRLHNGGISEVILATNPTVEGGATAHYIATLAREHGVRATRIAHGVPLGGELEYIDGGTLSHAFAGRREL